MAAEGFALSGARRAARALTDAGRRTQSARASLPKRPAAERLNADPTSAPMRGRRPRSVRAEVRVERIVGRALVAVPAYRAVDAGEQQHERRDLEHARQPMIEDEAV